MKKSTGNNSYRRQPHYKNSYGIRIGAKKGVVLPNDLYQEQSAPTISLFDEYKYLPFIKDGELYKELHRGELTRKQFFQQVVDVMSSISGGMADDLI